jgi:pimeloyl-ACP methyl ester carboxylesterase
LYAADASPIRAQFALIRKFVKHAGRLVTFMARLRLHRTSPVLALAILTQCAQLQNATLRSGPQVYILYALGGAPTSIGMVSLANRIRNLGGITVSTYAWDDYKDVVADIAAQPADTPIALIGYSLGANATSWIAHSLPQRRIALLIAYDPSIWYPVSPVGENVEHAILYHNNGIDPLGHARIEAPRLETVETWLPHVTLDFDESLHARTLAAVASRLQPANRSMAGARDAVRGIKKTAEPPAPSGIRALVPGPLSP